MSRKFHRFDKLGITMQRRMQVENPTTRACLRSADIDFLKVAESTVKKKEISHHLMASLSQRVDCWSCGHCHNCVAEIVGGCWSSQSVKILF